MTGEQICVCGHWRGAHFRLPQEHSQRGGCMDGGKARCYCAGYEERRSADQRQEGES